MTRTLPLPAGRTARPPARRPSPVPRLLPMLPVLAMPALLALPPTATNGGGAGPADVVSALVVVHCALLLVRHRRRPLSAPAAAVLGLPVVGVALAAMGAASPGAGLAGLGRYLQIFVLVPAAVLLLIRDRRDFTLLAWSFVGLAGWQGALGVHQYVTGTGASYRGVDIRAVGTFGAQDVMGMATVVSFGLVCAVGLALGRSAAHRRVLAAGCALALLVPLALSFSRGAWIATATACAVQLVAAGLRRALAVAAAVLAAGVILVGGLGVGTALLEERVSSITQVADSPDQSVVDRYSMWAAAASMWRERPLTGVGLKSFPEYRDGHSPLALSSGSDTEGAGAAYRRQPLLSPHNMYLLVLAEQGLTGLLALAGSWLALLACALRRVWRTRAAARPGAERTAAGECGLVACGLLVWQLTDFGYADIGGSSTVLTAVLLGLAGWWALLGGGTPTDDGVTATGAARGGGGGDGGVTEGRAVIDDGEAADSGTAVAGGTATDGAGSVAEMEGAGR
ncbi:O-antigen ligase family protein [Streptomyces sp. MMS24-I2-30]|uniref:O-antigen ligase family protein n=1 Tax=Streptomyces sp. MMS24-I2-30 TaxID=3351564 RepID=UPI003896CC86